MEANENEENEVPENVHWGEAMLGVLCLLLLITWMVIISRFDFPAQYGSIVEGYLLLSYL